MFNFSAIHSTEKLITSRVLVVVIFTLFALSSLSVNLGLISNQQLYLIFKTSYYLGAVAVVAGIVAISFRTKCTPKELLGKRYNAYFQKEISAYITYFAIGFVYINSAFIFPYLEASINKIIQLNGAVSKLSESFYLFMDYAIKALLEFTIILFSLSIHKTSSVQVSDFSKWILGISLWYGIWHILRAFDAVVFETQLMDDIYAPFGVLLNVTVSLTMLIYSFAVTTKAHREF